jgi:dihydroorotate dehydrogenase (NAD+) catalytic subunit
VAKPDLSVALGPLKLANPVLAASGTCGYGLELERWADISRFGALVLKGLSREPRAGNPPPRVAETASGLLNSIGLANIGVGRFVAEVLPPLRQSRATLIANVYATCVEDFVWVAAELEQAGGMAALELNLSCPNVRSGGIAFGQDPGQAGGVVAAVRRAVRMPLIVKLTPRVADIAGPARACEEAGADILSLPNTFPGMAVDLRTRRPVLGGNFGGLSGPAVKPLALKLVWEACRAVGIPVIGMGGIATWRDAAEFIVAGAWAVQVGTATLIDPRAGIAILEGLEAFLAEEGIGSVAALRGTLQLNPGC